MHTSVLDVKGEILQNLDCSEVKTGPSGQGQGEGRPPARPPAPPPTCALALPLVWNLDHRDRGSGWSAHFISTSMTDHPTRLDFLDTWSDTSDRRSDIAVRSKVESTGEAIRSVIRYHRSNYSNLGVRAGVGRSKRNVSPVTLRDSPCTLLVSPWLGEVVGLHHWQWVRPWYSRC